MQRVFPGTPVSECYFHPGQNIYCKVQEQGFQVQYNAPADRSIKDYTHMLLCLAFVPVADVTSAFNALRTAHPPAPHDVFDFFKKNYVTGTPRRDNRRAVPPRYPPSQSHTEQTTSARAGITNFVYLGLRRHGKKKNKKERQCSRLFCNL